MEAKFQITKNHEDNFKVILSDGISYLIPVELVEYITDMEKELHSLRNLVQAAVLEKHIREAKGNKGE